MGDVFARIWVLAAVALAIVCSAVWVTLRFGDDLADRQTMSRKRNFTVGMAEGFSLRRHGYYGVDFVKCGNCRVEKRKIGGFSIGCFNELVLENLSVVIPPDLLSSGDEPAKNARPVSAKELAAAIGVDDDFLKAHGWRMRFSGLRISNLSVATLGDASNAVPRFVARNGIAKLDGLHLKNCGIIQKDLTNRVGDAVLKIRPSLRLEWSGGEMAL